MNSIQYHIKQNGTWQKLNATPVFPFSIGELLDERLDEAYLTVYDSDVEHIPRLSEIRATISDGTDTKTEYFIVASDTSVELPAGRGKYKHEIYLIERTKLLEGIFCSSLTFTNAKGIEYKKAKLAHIEDLYRDSESARLSSLNVWFGNVSMAESDLAPILASPFYTNKPLPTAYEVAVFMCQSQNLTSHLVWEPSTSETIIDETYTTALTYNGQTYNWEDEVYPIALETEQELVYTICATASNGVYQNAFKFKVTFFASKEVYPLRRWTITDCITRACELALPLFGTQKPKYRLAGVEYDNDGNVIKPYAVGSLAEKYDKVFAPEFTLTQDNLREQLRVIFSYVHAEPWLDENDVIHAEEYGNTTVSDAQELPYVYSAGKSHINEYCTEVRSHAQNLASSLGYAKGTTIDPANGLYRSLRTDTAYARINEENGIAQTEKPIYSIDKVMCGIADSGSSSWWMEPVDITPYVFEATNYGANLSPFQGIYPFSRSYAIYYTMGQPNLYGLFYKAPHPTSTATFSPFSISNILSAVTGQDIHTIDDHLVETVGGAADLVFSITYKPISNHFISHGKSLYVPGETPFMQLYNQSENVVESQYYGENIKGVAARLGNVEEERTFILKRINDIPRVGQMLDEYAISAVSTEFYPWDIKCTVGLSKDFNRISEYVGINSQKRMYEVSERQATQRDILYKETLVIGKKPSGYSNAGKVFSNLVPFNVLFDGSFSNNGNWRTTAAQLATYKKNKGDPLNVTLLPVIGRALGNIVTLNFATKDNYSAGNSTVFIDVDSTVKGRWQTDVPYSNFYGRAWWSNIILYGKLNYDAAGQINFAYNIPQSSNQIMEGTGVTALANHRLRKDNRETLSYNLELEIKTTVPDLIIGSALAELSGWVNDTDVNPVLYFFDATKYSVSKFDKQYTIHDDDINCGDFNSSRGINNLWRTGLDNDFSLSLSITNPTEGEYGWVICTPIQEVEETVENEDGDTEVIRYQTGGDILLASNTPLPLSSESAYYSLDFYVMKN